MLAKNTLRNVGNKPASDPIQTLGKLSSVVSFGIFVILLIKYVDARNSRQSESEMQRSLASRAEENQERLVAYQSNAKELISQIKQFEQDTISFEELEAVQDEFMLLAKRSSCTLKKASPSEKQTTSLSFNSKGELEDAGPSAKEPEGGWEFETPRCTLALSLAGDLGSVLAFVKAVREKPWITTTSQLNLRRDSSGSGGMALELEVTFISLRPKAKPGDQLKPVPRA